MRSLISLLLVGSLTLPVSAGDPTAHPVGVAVIEGDVVPGVGAVTRIDHLVVNGAGTTYVEVDTDGIDTEADGALLRNGLLFLQEGQALAAPAGATLDSFDGLSIDARGTVAMNLFLDGTTGSSDDSGVYLGTTLLVQEGDVAAAGDLSPGTPYIGFFDVKLNGQGDVLVMASVDDPAVTSTVDRALVVLHVEPGLGLVGQTLVAREGQVLPGQVEPVADFDTGPHSFAFNDAGQALYIADLAGDTAVDHALYLDDVLLAQEGGPSPVPGRNWLTIDSAEIDLNNAGSWIVSASLDGDSASNLLIAVDGVKLVQEGDSLPAIAPFALTSFGSGPVHLADNGTVLWYGDWDDPDTGRDTGLFLNDQLVVQEGVTEVAGSVVQTLRGITDGYDLASDGTWMIFEAVLADGREGAFTIEIGPWTSLGQGLAGSGGVTPSLTGLGPLTPGSTATIVLSSGAPSAPVALFASTDVLGAPFLGGTLVPEPDLLLFLATDAGGSLSGSTNVPGGIPAGTPLHLQGWVADGGAPFGWSASNAVRGVFAAP